MKPIAFHMGMLAGCLALVAANAAESGRVKENRVNVRGMPSLVGEVITQLKEGEKVVVLEEVTLEKPKAGEPARWLKIQMPANTPVWIHSGYVDATTKLVNARRLNVRAGPGENFSVVGRLEKGAEVKDIRVEGTWMEIETPSGSYAFVAADLVEMEGAAPVEAAAVPAAAPAQPPAVPPAVPPSTVPVSEPPPVVASPPVAAPPSAVPPVTVPEEPLPKRVVTREGRVVRMFSIQSPTEHGLESLETGVLINYLDSSELGEDVNLKNFRRRNVQVSGEEFMDTRWKVVPVLRIETLRIIE